MQITSLFKQFDRLQKIYGNKNLDAIYGCGCIDKPKLYLVFMNPTAKNVAASKKWKGIKAPWLGTKHVWNMLHSLGLIDNSIAAEINSRQPKDWNYGFAKKVYVHVAENSMYITECSKATQIDSRALPNSVFKKYLELLHKEIDIVKPKTIILFGNQVSSIVLRKSIKVSDYRKKYELLEVNKRFYLTFPVYYPVGQGMRNIKIAKEDIRWIVKRRRK